MTGFWKSLFPGQEGRVLQRGHPSLGVLEFDPEEGAWLARVEPLGRRVSFLVAGKSEPDPRLLDQAARVLADYARFRQEITRLLELEAMDRPEFSDEIRHLEVAHVCFYWPERPSTAMIFFAGSEDSRVWHCDHVGGRASALNYDS